MTLKLTQVLDPAFAGFDNIIDVRSPAEFAEDHLPGAINLPVLSDEERAQVGTIYKQVSPFDARKIGGALVAANVARHIAGPLADRDGSWKALIYCWRGGQRSGSFETILAQIGWRVARIEGGYRSWRKLVVDQVQNQPVLSPVFVLDGNTGSAKTAILNRLADRGHQVIDLEGLANHRGSLFGGMPGGQPSQKMFEGRLAVALQALDTSRPVLVEAESSRIGRLTVPKSMWQAICAAPRIQLEIPVKARAVYTAQTYDTMVADPAMVAEIVASLAHLHPRARIEAWQKMVAQRNWVDLAEGLLIDHYDPRYRSHRARYEDTRSATVPLHDLSDMDHAAELVERALTQSDLSASEIVARS